MTAQYTVTRGIVLRETQTKEADKILTVLTEQHGKTAVIARGARRKNCKFSACAQPLVYSEWTLYHRGEWRYVKEGFTIALFEGLRENLLSYALGFYFAELVEAVAVEEVPSPALLRHFLNGLYALSVLKKPPELIKPAFELKLLSLAGYEPLVGKCAFCGNPNPEKPYLDVARGVILCQTCGVRKESHRALCSGSLTALRHILYGDKQRLYSFRIGKDALQRLSTATEDFLLAQLERNFKTLHFYKGLKL